MTVDAKHMEQSAKSVTLFTYDRRGEPESAVDALPLGPESLVWRYFGDNRMFLIGWAGRLAEHARRTRAGVLDHSVWFADTAAPNQAVSAAHLHDRVRHRDRQRRAEGSEFPSRDQGEMPRA